MKTIVKKPGKQPKKSPIAVQTISSDDLKLVAGGASSQMEEKKK